MRTHALLGLVLLGLATGCASRGTVYSANDAGKPHVLVVPIDQSQHHAEFDRFHDFDPAPNSPTA